MQYTKQNVNIMKKPKFANKEEHIQWLDIAIDLCWKTCNQSFHLLGACYIREREELKKEKGE